ncbi:MAG: ZIP family metal transporter [Lachnospiraceae bacterium]|nr:ZIP family metal transporter [Lachnospiraceae bacterium]
MMHTLIQVLCGTGFTFLMTTLGAAVVFFFRGAINDKMNYIFMGFASGVMMAAAVWSLLIPSIDQSQELGMVPWLPPAAGFALGGVFLYLVDKTLPWFHANYKEKEAGTKLLVLAVTVHNIPEGMAVGLAFVLAGQNPENPVYLASAIGLAIGIGIQNFPEGAAISLPVRQTGASAGKSFCTGCLSGIVEPLAGILVFLTSAAIVPLMPWLLAFAAGAMIYVVADELIPQAQPNESSNMGTISVMMGFLLMMILDVSLG